MRVGIFGGTFDPPHLGHLVVAQDAAEALGLDRLFWVPARRSPFRREGASAEPALRLRMVEEAIRGHDVFQLWTGELERPAPSYTVDTVEAFRTSFPAAELFLLLGTDQWEAFPRWKAPDRIAGEATLCVLDRRHDGGPGPGARGEAGDGRAGVEPDRYPAERLPTRRVDVSSTEVRERVRQGRSIRYLVTDGVRREIEEHGLYAGAGDAAPAGRPS